MNNYRTHVTVHVRRALTSVETISRFPATSFLNDPTIDPNTLPAEPPLHPILPPGQGLVPGHIFYRLPTHAIPMQHIATHDLSFRRSWSIQISRPTCGLGGRLSRDRQRYPTHDAPAQTELHSAPLSPAFSRVTRARCPVANITSAANKQPGEYRHEYADLPHPKCPRDGLHPIFNPSISQNTSTSAARRLCEPHSGERLAKPTATRVPKTAPSTISVSTATSTVNQPASGLFLSSHLHLRSPHRLSKPRYLSHPQHLFSNHFSTLRGRPRDPEVLDVLKAEHTPIVVQPASPNLSCYQVTPTDSSSPSFCSVSSLAIFLRFLSLGDHYCACQ